MVIHKNVPHVLKNATIAPVFKKTTMSLDEEALYIQQQMIEEDETKEKEKFSSGDNEVVGVKVNRAKNPTKKDKGKNVISETAKTENDASAKKKKTKQEWQGRNK